MRIVITANTSWYILNFRSSLIRSLVEAGHRLHVVAPRDEYTAELQQLGVTFHQLTLSQRGKNPFREVLTVFRLLNILRNIRSDVVLSYTIKCNLYVGFCSRLSGFKQIANISGLGEAFDSKGVLYRIVTALYKLCLRRAPVVFCQNSSDQQILVESGLLSNSQCHLIPGSGVDLDRFRSSASFIENTPRRFLMFGRLVPKKGYEHFMRVAKELHNDSEVKASFWIMGIEDKSRKDAQRLLERIMYLHRKGIITYIPARDNVASVLHEVDVVVLPSEYNEGIPRSLLEAMACGKPIIASDWRGCRDTVEHGINGYLVELGNRESLRDHIVKLASCPSASVRKMGEESRRLAEKRFSEDVVLEAYLKEVSNIDSEIRQ